MIRWLDALGWAKWPSLLLIGAPLAAYPSWITPPVSLKHCGYVALHERSFAVYRSTTAGEFMLHPVKEAPAPAHPVVVQEPLAFRNGGMVISGDDVAIAELCR